MSAVTNGYQHNAVDELREYAGWVFAGAVAIIAWFTRKDLSRYDDGLMRVSKLEQTTVTHDQLDRILSKVSSERSVMHMENKEWLQRIEDKIDSNEVRRSNTEHAIRDTVAAVNLKIAVIASKNGIRFGGIDQEN